jgi:hypothetical protein
VRLSQKWLEKSSGFRFFSALEKDNERQREKKLITTIFLPLKSQVARDHGQRQPLIASEWLVD